MLITRRPKEGGVRGVYVMGVRVQEHQVYAMLASYTMLPARASLNAER